MRHTGKPLSGCGPNVRGRDSKFQAPSRRRPLRPPCFGQRGVFLVRVVGGAQLDIRPEAARFQVHRLVRFRAMAQGFVFTLALVEHFQRRASVNSSGGVFCGMLAGGPLVPGTGRTCRRGRTPRRRARRSRPPRENRLVSRASTCLILSCTNCLSPGGHSRERTPAGSPVLDFVRLIASR